MSHPLRKPVYLYQDTFRPETLTLLGDDRSRPLQTDHIDIRRHAHTLVLHGDETPMKR
jgi:hypothetical protein